MTTINFLKIKTDMIFEFVNGDQILFNSLLLNDENPYWEKWLNEQKEAPYVYKCPEHWTGSALETILALYAEIKNTLVPSHTKVIGLYNFDGIYDIAYDIDDITIKRKIYVYIKLSIPENVKYVQDIECDFLYEIVLGIFRCPLVKINNFASTCLNSGKFPNIIYAERLINMVIKYKINETELMEFLLYVEPSLAKKCKVPMTTDLFERIMMWKIMP